MAIDDDPDRWARLRFAIIGPLLAAPPKRGELRQAISELVERHWQHPVNGTDIRFGYATIERWYYAARHAADPVGALRRRRRGDVAGVLGAVVIRRTAKTVLALVLKTQVVRARAVVI